MDPLCDDSSLVSTFVVNTTDSDILEEFLDETFELFPIDENKKLFKLLMRGKYFNFTIFHEIVEAQKFKLDIFKTFWSKVEERKFDYDDIHLIFFARGRKLEADEGTFLHYAIIENKDESDERIDAVIKIIRKCLKPEDQKNLLNELKFNVCGNFISKSQIAKFLEYFNEMFTPEETVASLLSKDESGNTIWHIAAKHSTPPVIEFIFKTFCRLKGVNNFDENNCNKEELKSFVLRKGRWGQNALMISAKEKSFDNFVVLLNKIFLTYLNPSEFIDEVDEDGKNIFNILCEHGSAEMIEHFLRTLKINLSQDEVHQYLKALTKNYKYISDLASQNISQEVFLDIIKRVFPDGKFQEILQNFDCTNEAAPFDPKTQASGKTVEKELEAKTEKSEIAPEKEVNKYPPINDLELLKVLSKCRLGSIECEPDRCYYSQEIIKIIKDISFSRDMHFYLNVVSCYDAIFFDFDCDEKFVTSPEFLECFEDYECDLIYVIVNGNYKRDKLALEVVKAALKIIFGDENNFIDFLKSRKVTTLKNIYEKIAIYSVLGTIEPSKRENVEKVIKEFIQPLFEIKNGNEIRELNRKFELTSKLKMNQIILEDSQELQSYLKGEIICYKTNLPQALLHSLYSNMISENFTVESENLFIDLAIIEFDHIKEDFLKLMSTNSVKRIFVYATFFDEESLKVLFEHIFDGQILLFGYEDSNLCEEIEKVCAFEVKEITKSFKWLDLCENTKNLLLRKKFNFQNQQINFGEVFGSMLEDVPSDILQILCSEQQLVINSSASSDDIPRVPRNFQIKEEVLYSSESLETFQNLFYSNNICIDELLKKVENSKIVLMADKEKSGKTIAMKKIYESNYQTSKFVKFISLNKPADEEDFKRFVKSKISDKIGATLFELAFKNGNVIIFIDEIRELNDVVKEWMKSLNNNQLWISANAKVGNDVEKFVTTDKIIPKKAFSRIRLAVTTNEELKNFYEAHVKDLNLASNIRENIDYLNKNYPSQTVASVLAQALKWEFNDTKLSDICERLLAKAKSDEVENARQIFQYFALKCFTNKEGSIFGLRFTKSNLPNNIENMKIIQFDDDNVIFTSSCWIDFFIADFLKGYFQSEARIDKNSKKIYDYFKRVLVDDGMMNVRKMLDEMEIYAQENCLASVGNALKREILTHSKISWRQGEEIFNLMTFVIKALRKANLIDNPVRLNEIVSSILIATIPYEHSKYYEDFLEVVFDVSFENFKKIVSFKENDYNYYEYLIERSKDHKQLEWMAQRYQKFDVNLRETQCETLKSLIDDSENKIYQMVIDRENNELLRFLLINVTIGKWKEILEMAFKSENITLYNTAKEVGKNKFDIRDTNETINKFEGILDEISQLHRDIQLKDLGKVKSFIERYERLNYNFKICQGREPCNALSQALKSKASEIFSFLTSKGFMVTNDDKLKNLYNIYKNEITNTNIANSVRNENYHKHLLLTKCLKSASSAAISFEETEKLIDDLFKLEKVRKILTAISVTDVKIILVNDKPRLGEFCLDEGADGMFYPGSNTILVTKCDNLKKKYGVFAHEACHSVMQTLYDNNPCKPYFEANVNVRNEYRKIVQHYRQKYQRNEINENIIFLVFSEYDACMHEPELIVRVPQMIAHYSKEEELRSNELKILRESNNIDINDDSLVISCKDDAKPQNQNDSNGFLNISKIERIQREYFEIFDFFVKFVEPDLDIIDGVELRMLNDKFGIWKKVKETLIEFTENNSIKNLLNNNANTTIRTRSSHFVMKCLYDIIMGVNNVNYLKIKSENIFVDLEILEKDKKLLENFEMLMKSPTIKRVFIDCGHVNLSKDLFERLNRFKPQIISIYSPISVHQLNFSFAWFDNDSKISLSQTSRNKILSRIIKFKLNFTAIKSVISQNLIDEEFLLEFFTLKNIVEINKVQQFNMPFKDRQLSLTSVKKMFNEKDFISNVKNDPNKFFIISGVIGSGKSSTLKSIYTKFCENDEKNEFWVSYISLKDKETKLKENFEENFMNTFNGTDKFEKFVFKCFKEKLKIVLFLDDFDALEEEIKEKIKTFIQNSYFAKVFLTYRDTNKNLQLNNAQVLTLAFSDSEKIDYVLRFIEDKSLAKNLCKIIKDHKISFGFPLLISFIDLEDKNLLSSFNVYETFESFYQRNYQKWIEPFDRKSLLEQNKKSMNHEQIHYRIALRQKGYDKILGVICSKIDWKSQEITNCLSMCGNDLKFHNDIEANFWVAKFLKIHLARFDVNCHEYFMKFFFDILSKAENKNICWLLDASMENFESEIAPSSLYDKYFENITKNDKEELTKIQKALKSQFCSTNFNICRFVFQIIKNIQTKSIIIREVREEDRNKTQVKISKGTKKFKLCIKTWGEIEDIRKKL